MTEVEEIFAELGISQYLDVFIEHGFDTWESVQDITESDLDFLEVKLGHRRKLQRKIANSRGLSPDRALASPPLNTANDDRQLDDQKASVAKADGKEAQILSGPQGAKRKYRRHPKPDENAPDRPPSAYVIFSNRMREELKGQNLSFTEIAKLVGERWQSISPAEKDPYEQQATAAKERYNAELSAYKKTSQYAEYAQYLAEFKARQSNQQQANLAVTDLDVPKRPKLENHFSPESSGASSSTTQHGRNTPTERMSGEPSPAVGVKWPPLEGHHPTTFTLPVVQSGNSRGSPSSPSGNTFSGYRGSVYVGSSQPLPWREGNCEERSMPLQQRRRVSSIGDRPAGYPGPPIGDPLNLTDAVQQARRMGQVPYPPSTTASISSHSAASSAYLTPRTPLEPPLERAPSISTLFPHKSPGNYDNQLPPLRASSLSPQSRAEGSQQSPSSIRVREEFTTPMPPLREHHLNTSSPQSSPGDKNDPRAKKFGSAEDSSLDPVSALLRAGEIVDLNSRGPPPN
ncbi:hypothetical protein OIDMADRAFT_143526 [Oidiodendron maius Zn]|uniref:HMG box domain-containing protein n=1 Tax=Oidiodendron maius (strain Zn) TaxID=913774 RepID=A0A0C3DPT1_OIDMZ|nr:hypothetical protein OIDMADRAFT_143526 [Oidiodendron maius Zn]